MSQNFHFQEKVVVVTGGGSGIGKSLALAFARQGANVVVVDLKNAQEVARMLPKQAFQSHEAFSCNVANTDHIQSMIRQVKQKWGKIDIYCSNAGIAIPSFDSDAIARHSEDQWTKILQVNVYSHVIAIRELLNDWERGMGDGVFVITASAAGLLTQIGDASYGVSKAAAVSFAEHVAIACPKIQVHCLCPQAVDTPLVGDPKAPKGKGSPANSAMTDGILSPDFVADCTLQGIEEKSFWIFPHERVPEYVKRRAIDHARWLKGMQRMQARLKSTNSKL